MTIPALSGFDNSIELRTCLRDLVGLLGLPALWSGREPQATVRLLSETLAEILSLDACCVTTFLLQEKPLRFLYANGKAVDTAEATDWLPFTGEPINGHQELRVTREATPCGELRVARFSLGYYGHTGQITVGSVRNDFPKPTELVLLRSAASLAASGLRTALLTHEREKALRVKDEFLAMLGHELRNPLAPIVAALELMKMKAAGALTAEQTIIERQVGHLTGLVDDLLDVTRITTSKIELKHEFVELRSIVAAAIETALPLIERRQHRLSCEVPDSGLLIKGDARRLAQVVSNLLINAAKYTEPGGRIVIVGSRDADKVSLKIKDNGIGIEPALLPHIFDLFQQGAVSIDRSRGGLGIGLCVVKSLVTTHGGTVTAETGGAGLGSTFTVTLPLAQDDGGTNKEKETSAEILVERAERILVVDDNRDAADIMGELLRALGHEVYVQYTPLGALSLCEKVHPTVVILDIGLPGINGYELAGMLRLRFKGMSPRIIAVSGYGQPQDRARSYDAGIEIHLTKPIAIDVLVSHLHGSASGQHVPINV
ncbi:MAG: hybrid sensor histidine kinase/response regulator [Herminiimonas sp.]|nr:hybrid sensor histidine kinase/response regulator [Herminiimonas sp.]